MKPVTSEEAVAVFSTDWHLDSTNIEQITELVRQQCKLAEKLEVKLLVCLGDVFESRIAQREDVLTAFGVILDVIQEHKLKLLLIPGNHDKTNYFGEDSFLTPFKTHPCLALIERAGGYPFPNHNLHLHFLPYFKQGIWLDRFAKLVEYIGESNVQSEEKHILCTHISITGSRDNDNHYSSSTISASLFKDFFKVFSGHYHNQQKISKNFYHLPAIRQAEFDEDEDKGFTVLYSDGSHNFVKSTFKKFIKLEIDLDNSCFEDLVLLKQRFSNNKDNIRFEFIGSEKALKALKKEDFVSIGIDVKTKSREIEDDIKYSETEEVKEHTSGTIREEFTKFCIQDKLIEEIGLPYLNKKL